MTRLAAIPVPLAFDSRIRPALITACALSLFCLGGATRAIAYAYTIFDLGPNTIGVALNSAGQVSGDELNFDGQHQAFVYDVAGLHPLGTLDGTESFAGGINSFGHMVGAWATADGGVHPFLHVGNGPLVASDALAELPGFDRNSASDLNDANLVVGAAYHSTGGGSRAVEWQGGNIVVLGVLPGGDVSSATAVNASGQIAGYSTSATTNQHAVLFEDGGVFDLGTLPGGGVSFAYDLNDEGQVVGYSEYDNALHLGHAFLWQNGVMADLGIGVDSTALGINAAGQIVGTAGYSFSSSADSAFLWQNGIAFDLNTLIPPGTSWDLIRASGINDRGQIVGSGTYQGQAHGFVLTPIPEPGSLALTVIGFLALIGTLGRADRRACMAGGTAPSG